MIRYALACSNDHGFESWFRDSAAYEALEATGQLACPTCPSTTIRKALMAPSVLTSRRRRATGSQPDQASPQPSTAPVSAPAGPQPATLLEPRERHLRDMLRSLHREITDKADNVGRAFASEARRIHDGDTAPRSIYGEASRDEVKALIEDGIPLLPMPVPPDDHN